MNPSLRTKLTLLPAFFVGLSIAVAVFGARYALQAEFERETDRSMSARARQISVLLESFGEDNFVAVAPQLLAQARAGNVGQQQLDVFLRLDLADGQVFESVSDVRVPFDEAWSEGDAGTEHGVRFQQDDASYRGIALLQPSGSVLTVVTDVSGQAPIVRGVTRLMSVIGVLLVLAAAAVGAVLARRLTGPIRRLSAATATVAATAQPVARLPVEDATEAGQLTENFNAMMEALRESRDRQERLIHDAGHELRTPLTALKANAELLLLDDLPSGDRTQLLGAIGSEVDELAELIAELTMLGGSPDRFEEPEMVDLLDVAEAVTERMQRRHGRDVRFVSRGGSGGGLVRGNRQLIDRAVSNLVDNAVKFSDEGAPVEVHVESGQRTTEVRVRDHGPGIPESEIDVVFDRFHRSPEARGVPGSGLGLSIVEHVATRHGGEVFAENAPQGGAIVGFRLPDWNGGG